MDNIFSVRGDGGALREACRNAQTWILSLLYLGTFGSFIGYSFAFGLSDRHSAGPHALGPGQRGRQGLPTSTVPSLTRTW